MRYCTLDELLATLPSDRARLEAQLDRLGEKSAEAQGLRQPITSMALLQSPKSLDEGHHVHVLVDDQHDGAIVGYLKTGTKHLYYVTAAGAYKEMDPVCVLDFYVVQQRQGHGAMLFRSMLERLHVAAKDLAYDRPSPKLGPFLAKHFQLRSFVPQSNRFVIFDAFFEAQESNNRQ
ncbi:hypothetical protein SPRG_08206 [Saprolegnia parasitica CBS 223.65]|uniref:Alpha-tubulin N-acetyltransferase n=1 Tax=Saprolegnia parasitica (strain CBS 223.65) TaxID=695850 RepID=A0A067C7B4_SAPPC|nr:hypothetical protein SPRG_08206 [Saprolegnia parasitica CBS 223.65]KDO26403.1 hypothetical protein SPRG_08206 [Saprolegnia parasitica CBS 223.65]|eukprot:XP_012202841.1 hypothetical protein SPRG_08206 [Saprolegnia parasitica CBS 223.65]